VRYGLKALRPPIVATVATMPERLPLLERMLDSIELQVDRINVYLDGHDKIPDRITGSKFVVEKADPEASLHAAGKFRWAAGLDECYHFVCDDDILFPGDYVSRMIAAIERYDRKAAVGVHAIRFQGPPYAFYKKRVNYSMGMALPEDMRVHALGTGTLAYWAPSLPISIDDFPRYNAEDLFVAICAKRVGVPMICVGRDAYWLRSQPVHTWSVYGGFIETRDDSWQSAYLNAAGPWPTLRLPAANHMAIQRWFYERIRGQ
jgi:hypothetical protein